jgi:hypothetical protein
MNLLEIILMLNSKALDLGWDDWEGELRFPLSY